MKYYRTRLTVELEVDTQLGGGNSAVRLINNFLAYPSVHNLIVKSVEDLGQHEEKAE